MVPRFPVPKLVRTGKYIPFSRTWFAGRLDPPRSTNGLRDILRRLSPTRYARLRGTDVRTVLLALLRELSARMPIQEWIMDDLEGDGIYEDDIWSYADWLPLDVFGMNPWEDSHLRAPLLLCWALCEPGENQKEIVLDSDNLKEHRHWVELYLSHQTRAIPLPRLPRGRKWTTPWHALPDLIQYCTGSTGYGFLDYDQDSLDQGGWDSYPPMNLDEIRSSERIWKECKPIYDRIFALVNYIDRHQDKRVQRRRLELYVNVLLGEPDALQQVTEPKRTQTLGAIFTKERR